MSNKEENIMANQKSKKSKKSYYVKNGKATNVTVVPEFTIGQLAYMDRILEPGVDIDSIIYEEVDKDGNILDTQTATLSIQKGRGAKCN